MKADAGQYVGMLNAEKCIKYLRGIGVEIDDATADSWLDIQGMHRFLKSEKAVWRQVTEWRCRCGAMRGFSEEGRGRKRLPRASERPAKPARCEDCQTGFITGSLKFYVCRDGTVQDYRRGVDAVVPLRLDEWAGGL